MDWHVSWSKERKPLVHTVLVLVLSSALLFSGEWMTGPAANLALSLFYYPFHELRQNIERLSHAADDNAALSATVVDLSTRLQFYGEILEENRRLRTLLGFTPPLGFRIVPTEVVGVYGAGIPNTVVINLGAKNSLSVNQTVISRDGVAGRVAKVMNEYSVVYLLTEPRCRVSARVKRSREQGIIRYQLGRGMYFDNCPQGGDVVIGDTIITSGLGGVFPEGLVVGTVRSVESQEGDFFYDVALDPTVNFNGIDELYVLMMEQ